MTVRFKLSSTRIAVLLAFPLLAAGQTILAAEPYPASPPTLTTQVKPNIMLLIDTSGSMGNTLAGEAQNKLSSAKDVATTLISQNPTLRWGLFTFDGSGNGGTLRAPVGTSVSSLTSTINGLTANGNTPLGETAFEVSRYWAGEGSFYGKSATSMVDGKYVSPIQYRCQKNFNIILTDGFSNGDDNLPGIGYKTPKSNGVSYTSYDPANGNPVTKTFKVCYDSGTVSSVACPSQMKLDANTTNPDFPGGWAYPATSSNSFNKSPDNTDYTANRSILDVAAYMQDRDMRIGGTDLDGVSFDDPKYKKQNVSSYTVGFGVSIPVLQAAAYAGNGKYYTSSTKAQLAAALSNAVNSIATQSSNAGGMAVASDYSLAGNKIFQPVFNPQFWYGELNCFDVNTTATNNMGSPCTPNPKAVIPASRVIHSNKPWNPSLVTTFPSGFSFVSGSLSSMTAMQKSLLGSTSTEQTNVINVLRGNIVAGYRDHKDNYGTVHLLGDIIDGRPSVISVPSGLTTDSAYPAFITSNANRNMVFIGANDGMLHAFNISDMTEIMGYIPSAVYKNLKTLTSTDYGTVTAPHVYHVNGSLRNMDVKLNGAWKTILVGGLAQGGQSYFALDASSSSTLASPSTIKWEWSDASDSEMGYTFGAPLIYNARASATTAKPVVIMANGYNNSYDDTASGGQKTSADSSALYIVDVETGKLIKKISVPGSNGLSAPAGVDYGPDGVVDYVYAGDMSGKLWRFDLTASDPNNFKVISTPIFDASADVVAGNGHPIALRPAIMQLTKADGSAGGNLILFGTGKFLTDNDRIDTTQQTFYAVVDDMSDSPTTVKRSDMVSQPIVEQFFLAPATNFQSATYRKLSSNTIDLTALDNTKKGWYIDLPTASERLAVPPILLSDKLVFGTGIPVSTQACMAGGLGWVMGVNPLTGSVTQSSKGKEYSFVDVLLDGKSSAADKVLFPTGTSYVGGYQLDGIPTEITYVAAASKAVSSKATDTGLGDAGSGFAAKEVNYMGVYPGNAGSTPITTGKGITIPQASGSGTFFVGVKGSTDVSKASSLSPSSGVRVIPSTWRELKQ